MLKSYEEMRKIDVSPYCEKRDGYKYLNYAHCIDLLRRNGAEDVRFRAIPDERTGHPLRMTETEFTDKYGTINRAYMVHVEVIIDESRYEIQMPVMSGTNPVKDNSMNQNRVWTSICRAFVKCVAMNTGLGFDLWLKEEYNRMFEQLPETGERKTDKKLIELVEKACISHGIDLDMWVASNGKTRDTLTVIECKQMLTAIKKRYGDDD